MSLSLVREKDRNEGFRKCDWAYEYRLTVFVVY